MVHETRPVVTKFPEAEIRVKFCAYSGCAKIRRQHGIYSETLSPTASSPERCDALRVRVLHVSQVRGLAGEPFGCKQDCSQHHPRTPIFFVSQESSLNYSRGPPGRTLNENACSSLWGTAVLISEQLVEVAIHNRTQNSTPAKFGTPPARSPTSTWPSFSRLGVV